MQHRHNFTGLGIALLMHLSVPAILFLSGSQAATPAVAQAVPVSLSMFKPAPPPAVVAPVVVAKVEPPPPKPKPQVKPKPKPKPKIKNKPKPKPIPEPEIEPVVEQQPVEEIETIVEYQPQQVAIAAPAPTPVAPELSAPPPAQPSFDPGKLALIEASYQSQLRQLIEAKKTYPRRAKRLGREGKVFVSFVVYPDGTIETVELKEGSGVKILDQAAIKTILSISGVLPFPNEINRDRWTFTVPISYELL